jgi:hypothetical protein
MYMYVRGKIYIKHNIIDSKSLVYCLLLNELLMGQIIGNSTVINHYKPKQIKK